MVSESDGPLPITIRVSSGPATLLIVHRRDSNAILTILFAEPANADTAPLSLFAIIIYDLPQKYKNPTIPAIRVATPTRTTG